MASLVNTLRTADEIGDLFGSLSASDVNVEMRMADDAP